LLYFERSANFNNLIAVCYFLHPPVTSPPLCLIFLLRGSAETFVIQYVLGVISLTKYLHQFPNVILKYEPMTSCADVYCRTYFTILWTCKNCDWILFIHSSDYKHSVLLFKVDRRSMNEVIVPVYRQSLCTFERFERYNWSFVFCTRHQILLGRSN
jgi:hypothetical protein